MTRFEDAFDDLIAQHPPGDPDQILAAARLEVSADRSRHRTRSALAAAAVILVLAALAATIVATRDDPSDRVRAGQGPASTTTPTPSTVQVFFSAGTEDACRATKAVERPYRAEEKPGLDGQLETALGDLLEGPTPEEQAQGLTSPFAHISGVLNSSTIEGTTATVDLNGRITDLTPNASTACGSASVLAVLSSTVGQFPVDQMVFTIDGDRSAFYAWLGLEPPDDGETVPTTTIARNPTSSGGPGHAVASVLGVTLRMGPGLNTGVGISRDPAASAYAIGTDAVVFQETAPDVDTTVPPVPPDPTGEIKRWVKNRGTVTLTVDPAADQQVLLDAGIVDGTAQALVALRRGDTPDTARERLVLVDLETQEMQEVVDVAAWESGHIQARVLADGDVVGLMSGEGQTFVVRWTARSDDPVWSTTFDAGERPSVAVRGERAVLVDTPEGGSESIRTRRLDLASGSLGAPVILNVASGQQWCSDWYDDDELSCARNGSAGAVDQRGIWRDLQTPTGAVVTASR